MYRIFEPSLTMFDKNLVINYKKVGTRFLREIASGGILKMETDNKQIDCIISSMPMANASIDSNKLSYKFSTNYITMPWHTPDNKNYLLKSFSVWKDDISFLDTLGVKSYTELFFENENNITFIIRNPIERFFSGVIQISTAYFCDLKNNTTDINRFKNILGESDDTVALILDIFTNEKFNSTLLNQSFSQELIIKLYSYFLQNNWPLVTCDIHTEPYLIHFKELMYNVNNSSKIKIIDLSHMRSNKSVEFFSELSSNNIKNTIRSTKETIDTNLSLSNILIEAYNRGTFSKSILNMKIDFIHDYLKDEMIAYNQFINSKHFINLAD